MRLRFFYFYLCIGFVLCCTFFLLICKQTPQLDSSSEPLWLQESDLEIVERQKFALVSLSPDLAGLRSVKKEALNTIPVRSPNCSRSVFLTIHVASSPGNFEQRNAIRSSWGKVYLSGKKEGLFRDTLGSFEPGLVLKTVFVLGHSSSSHIQALVNHEMDTYGDFVFGEFEN